MTFIASRSPIATAGTLFSRYDRGIGYDEMFGPDGMPRPHCHALFEDLRAASSEDLGLRQIEADKAFLTQGITFTVYGDEQGTERIFPFDLLPRIITAAEWRTLVAGLTQRLTAINLFRKDASSNPVEFFNSEEEARAWIAQRREKFQHLSS